MKVSIAQLRDINFAFDPSIEYEPDIDTWQVRSIWGVEHRNRIIWHEFPTSFERAVRVIPFHRFTYTIMSRQTGIKRSDHPIIELQTPQSEHVSGEPYQYWLLPFDRYQMAYLHDAEDEFMWLVANRAKILDVYIEHGTLMMIVAGDNFPMDTPLSYRYQKTQEIAATRRKLQALIV